MKLGKEFGGEQFYLLKLKSYIKPKKFSAIYQIIAEIIGIENALKLGKELAGEAIYLPKLNSNMSPLLKERDRRILEEFKDYSVKAIARKYNITSCRIYQIIRRERAKRRVYKAF